MRILPFKAESCFQGAWLSFKTIRVPYFKIKVYCFVFTVLNCDGLGDSSLKTKGRHMKIVYFCF